MHCSKFRNLSRRRSDLPKFSKPPPKTAKRAAFRQDPSTSNTAKRAALRQDPSTSNTAKRAALLTNRNDFCMISMDCTSMYIYVCDRRKERL